MSLRRQRRVKSPICRRLAAEWLEDRSLLAVLLEHGPSDPVRVLVPTQADYGDLGFDWTGVAEPFDDSTWTQVLGQPNGVGFDRGSGAYDSAIGLDVEASMYEQSTTLFARAAFDVKNATAVGKLTLGLRYDDGFIAWLNGIEVARTNATGSYPAWNARATAEYEAPLTPIVFDLSTHVSHLRDGENVIAIRLLNDSPTGDDALLQFTLTGESREGPPLAVDDVAETAEGQAVTINVLANDREGSDAIDPATVTITTQPQHGSASVNPDGTITYTPNGIYNGPDTFAYTVRDDSITGQPGNRTLVATNSPVRALIPANDSLGVTWRGQDPSFNDSAWQPGTFGVGYDTSTSPVDYNPFLGLNVAAMRNVNATLYMRSAFTLDDPASVETLSLRIRYDDGFVAFLNGVQLVARNSPGFLTYNSEAPSGERTDTLSLNYETFDLTAYRDALKAGKNILAIHGLNQQIDSSDLLMQPELTAFVNPRGRISNPATVSINVASVEYPPIASDDNYTVDEGTSLIVGGIVSPDLTPGPGQTLWPTSSGGNGHLYRPVVVSGGITWREAHDAARAAGGKLASISSQAENEFVYQLLSSSQYWSTVNNDYFGPWLGGFQAGVPGSTTWKWLSGDPFAFTSWAPTEPNGSGELQNVFYFTPDPGIPRPTWADQVWNGSLLPSSYVIEWDVAPDDRVSLVAEGATWRYRDTGVVPTVDAQGDTWKEHDYDDANWSTGIAELGFGDGDEGTVIKCGPTNPTCNQNNYPTTWFRRHFTLTPSDRARFESLYLEFVRDDGIAVYINGVEVARDQLPGTLGDSSVTAATFASGTAAQADELTFQPPIILDLSSPSWSNLLRDGDNVIAVEIHQDRANSSDLSFNLHLAATLDKSTGLLANDIERDNQPMTAILVTGPTHGTLDFGSDGTFEYVPNPGFVGVDTFTYRASDGMLVSGSATVSITVNHLPPTANNDAYVTNEDIPLNIPASLGVLANDTDTQSHSLTAVLADSPSHGTLTLNVDGSFQYVPESNHFGVVTFSYFARDGVVSSNIVSVEISIESANDPPSARDDIFEAQAGQLLVVREAVPKDHTLLADAVSEFSGTQGLHGWYYGYYDRGQDITAGYQPADFTAFPNTAGNFSPTNHFDSALQRWRIFNGDPPWTTIGAALVHPSISGREHWAIRRWVSDYAGQVRIQGVLAKDNLSASSNGVLGIVYVNGIEIWSQFIGGTDGIGFNFDLPVTLEIGSVVDLVLDPVTLDGSDRTRFVASIFVDENASSPEVLIPAGASWRYFDTLASGAALPIDANQNRWQEIDFDDSNWSFGPAILGYGGIDVGPVATEVGFGGDSNNKNITTLFRRSFDIADISQIGHLTIGLLVDDAAAVYINSQEVLRYHLAGVRGDAAPASNALATNNGDESRYIVVHIDPSQFQNLLSNGRNTIAIEVHQAQANSTDLGFDLSLTAAVLATPSNSGVLVNDLDVDGDYLTAQLLTQPTHGALALQSNGTFTYAPESGFTGVDQFTYRATDGQHFSEPTTVRIVVAPPNKAPADLNADGAVNAADVAFLLASYGKSTAAKAIEGDLDGDARIGVRDVIALRNAITAAPSPAAAAAIVARVSDRAIVKSDSANVLRAARPVRETGNSASQLLSMATDLVLAERVSHVVAQRERSSRRRMEGTTSQRFWRSDFLDEQSKTKPAVRSIIQFLPRTPSHSGF